MTDQVLELAAITLAPGTSEADLLATSDAFQTGFLDNQDGFLRRDMVRKGDGTFLDVILWQSRAHADAVFEKAKSSEIVGKYFGLMQFDAESTEDPVQFHALLKSYTTQG
jgi:hypothetical protein